jgi:putrescine transport system ATP-binding protein
MSVETPIVQLQQVSKNFGEVYAVDDVSLDIHHGEFFSMLGASGCGKTTLLRILAGFETPSSGRIFIDGQDMTHVPAYQRPVNMMFQSYALFPHMSVADNIAYGLKREGMNKIKRAERVNEMMALVKIEKYAKRKPHQLSGGQRQRVALARALAKQPKILLLDEPLGALDKKLREETQFELVNLQERLKTTFIVVTHDQEEAMTMSSRIALLHAGRIEQLDTPRRIYEYPATRYAASFIGLANLFAARVVSQNEDLVTLYSDQLERNFVVHHGQPLAPDAGVSIIVRPEKILVASNSDDSSNVIEGVIKEIAYLGDVSIYHAEIAPGLRIKFTQSNVQPLAEQPLSWEQKVRLKWSPYSCGILSQ